METYKVGNKEAKKGVQRARFLAYDDSMNNITSRDDVR